MELLGQDGNIFGIMGRASRLLKRAGMKEEDEALPILHVPQGICGDLLYCVIVYSVLHRAIKTLKGAGQQQEAAAMAFLVFSAKNGAPGRR